MKKQGYSPVFSGSEFNNHLTFHHTIGTGAYHYIKNNIHARIGNFFAGHPVVKVALELFAILSGIVTLIIVVSLVQLFLLVTLGINFFSA
jgi:hypothetical protein